MCVRAYVNVCGCVRVCACVHACVCVHVCVCVYMPWCTCGDQREACRYLLSSSSVWVLEIELRSSVLMASALTSFNRINLSVLEVKQYRSANFLLALSPAYQLPQKPPCPPWHQDPSLIW